MLVKTRFSRRFVPRREIGFVSAAGGRSLVIERHGSERIVVGGALLDDARRTAIARVIDERVGASAAARVPAAAARVEVAPARIRA